MKKALLISLCIASQWPMPGNATPTVTEVEAVIQKYDTQGVYQGVEPEIKALEPKLDSLISTISSLNNQDKETVLDVATLPFNASQIGSLFALRKLWNDVKIRIKNNLKPSSPANSADAQDLYDALVDTARSLSQIPKDIKEKALDFGFQELEALKELFAQHLTSTEIKALIKILKNNSIPAFVNYIVKNSAKIVETLPAVLKAQVKALILDIQAIFVKLEAVYHRNS